MQFLRSQVENTLDGIFSQFQGPAVCQLPFQQEVHPEPTLATGELIFLLKK